ncbi:pilus assembly protein TadG-related protein [Altererythrobacter sp. MTPC7]|uniref:pilus assembly protein TadG-related protein n=1 Tax=Altererythrobacter sp. MTPC7 TaxID=3056567 RepID=UPI0036F27C44
MKPAAFSKPLLSRLLRDRSGNTLAIVAAATAPLVAMVGSAVDIGRGYVAQSRLQQACDAGTLAARKRLGSDLPPSGHVLGQVRMTGKSFFDLNFPEGRYDTTELSFVMTLEEDFAITGAASANLPTAVMGIFGKNNIPIAVSCGSRMNFTNLDIMMVLDTTGSMRHTNSGDTQSRMDSMRSVITAFAGNLEEAKAPDTRIRFGFVPYATNVNAGHLLENQWVANTWQYQSRKQDGSETTPGTRTYDTNWAYVSGSRSDWQVESTYDATYYPAVQTPPTSGQDERNGSYTPERWVCEGSQPANSFTKTDTLLGQSSEPFAGPPAGTREIDEMQRYENGTLYRTTLNGETCTVESQNFDEFVHFFDRITDPSENTENFFLYTQLNRNVADWRTTTLGCMEELPTYQISDYASVDLTRALDLDIDHVPDGTAGTQWGPRRPDLVYARSLTGGGGGSFTPDDVRTSKTFSRTGYWWMSECPEPAQNLAEMTKTEIETYLATLTPKGATYHDIGMIWGARLLSPDGLFAAENADESNNKPTTRHLIFLTDGQTEPYDVAYGPYGVEPLDKRRWDPDTSSMSLVQTVEERFKFACREIKKKNTTVWVIAFGTSVNAAMTDCAGPGHYFEAANAAQLDEAFASIARSMGDLRVSK